jgi:hypothetical protein
MRPARPRSETMLPMACRPVSLPRVLPGPGDARSPRAAGQLNDHDHRVARAKGERGWRSHDHAGESCYVIAWRFAAERAIAGRGS